MEGKLKMSLPSVRPVRRPSLLELARRIPKSWLVTLFLFGMLSWMYSQATPLLETDDETSHFEVVAYIAAQKRLPTMPEQFRTGAAPTVSAAMPHYYVPPLYHLLAAFWAGEIDVAAFATAVIPNPNFARGYHISPAADLSNKNMYVHTADQRPPYSDWAAAFWRVRWFSRLLGLVTLLGGLLLTRLLWPLASQKKWRWPAISLVAFNPTFLYLSGGVNNDTLLVAISTWCFVLMVFMLTHQPPGQKSVPGIGWREAVLALLLAAGILTKQSAFILWPLAGLTILLAARPQTGRWWVATKKGVALFAAAMLIGGWWYLRNWRLYGDPLAFSTHNAPIPVESVADRLSFFLGQCLAAFQTYWAAFGWGTISVHPTWYTFFAFLTLVGMSGWLRPTNSPAWPREVSWLLWTAVFLNATLLMAWLWRTPAAYGRLMFPVIAPLACLLVEGWRRWLVRMPDGVAWVRQWWPAVVPATILTLALLVPVRYLQPAFANPIAKPPELAQATPITVRFDDIYQLVGYTFTPAAAVPGQVIDLTLFWQLAQLPDRPEDLDIFVQLAPHNPERQIAGIDTLLGTARYPTSVWREGETIKQHVSLTVPPDAPAPALYWFNVGLYHLPTDTRLPVLLEASHLLAERMVRLGPLAIRPNVKNKPEPTFALYKEFDNHIRLHGYDLTLPQPGETSLQLTLYWQAQTPPVTDWVVFVHLLDEAGQLVAQQDTRPVSGHYPTTWWQPGDWIVDTHTFTLSADNDLSGAVFQLGLYNSADGQRAVVVDGQQQALPDNVVLLRIPHAFP
jgi:hypothetical protein